MWRIVAILLFAYSGTLANYNGGSFVDPFNPTRDNFFIPSSSGRSYNSIRRTVVSRNSALAGGPYGDSVSSEIIAPSIAERTYNPPPVPRLQAPPPAPIYFPPLVHRIQAPPPAPIYAPPPAPRIPVQPPAPVYIAPPAPKLHIPQPPPKLYIPPLAPELFVAPPAPKMRVLSPAPKPYVPPQVPRKRVLAPTRFAASSNFHNPSSVYKPRMSINPTAEPPPLAYPLYPVAFPGDNPQAPSSGGNRKDRIY